LRVLFSVLLGACTVSQFAMEVWGKCEHDGKDVKLITIKAPSGAYATISSYGATMTSIWVPDKTGKLGDVLLGYDSLKGYEGHVVSMGQTVGRVANRIAKGKFSLEGQEYKLAVNNGPNCLHAGTYSYDCLTWDVVEATENSVALRLESPDMDEGFPGKLIVTVEFTFVSPPDDTKNAALHIKYTAETDKTTVVNLTNHAYFNLLGHTGGDKMPSILDHIVTFNTDLYTAVDDTCIPTGNIETVSGTPFDYRKPTRIGDHIDDGHCQLIYGNGYDHNFVLTAGEPKPTPEGTPQGMRCLGVEIASGVPKKTRVPDAVMSEPSMGRVLETFTEEPGLQFFTDNIPEFVLELGGKGKTGVDFTARTGVCFETQHFPDSPNQPSFPSIVLRPGLACTSETVYWFSVQA